MRGRKGSTKIASNVDPLVIWVGMFAQGEGISFDRLENLSDVSSVTIRCWLHGQRGPSLGNLRAVVNALGYDLALKPLNRIGGGA